VAGYLYGVRLQVDDSAVGSKGRAGEQPR